MAFRMSRWRGDELRQVIREANQRRLRAAAIVVQNRAKQLLSVAGTGIRSAAGVVPTPGKSRAKRIYGAFPSAPGEPPHKQTGRLRGSVTHEQGALDGKDVVRIGTNVQYGRRLELGTRKMAPRPWLRRALAEMRGQIRAIFQKSINLPR